MMHRDAGFTLVEVMIAMFLMAIVSVVFTAVVSVSFDASRDFTGAARSNDDVRLVLQQIDREFRSAERICEPTPGTASDQLDFYTRAFSGTTVDPSGVQHIIYRLDDLDGDGVATDLDRSNDGGATWRTVIGNVVNVDKGVTMFATQGDTASAAPSEGKVLTVTIWVDADPNDRISPRLATTEISGRNIWTPNAPGC